jgi:hypothetical protein
MEKSAKKKLTLTVVLTLVHNLLFWNNNLGINTLLFSILIIGIMWWQYPASFFNRQVLLVTLSTILSAILVTLHGSDASKLCHIVSFTILIAYVHIPQIRSIHYAFMVTLESFGKLPLQFVSSDNENTEANVSSTNKFRNIQLSIVPLLFLITYYWIYKFANPVFDTLSDKFWNAIFDYLATCFENVSFTRIIFSIIGFTITATCLYKPIIHNAFIRELKLNEILFRTKKEKHHTNVDQNIFSFYGLKNEYLSALIMVVMINILLVIVNLIDINWIWINFELKRVNNLSQFVHEGTYLLIISILLSMGIIQYFFRKNLNFYTQNRWLKVGCYVWITQNIIMVISVALRNYHYIAQHGLAYKRIGVIFFLSLTTIGLITQIIKIKFTKSGFYMLKINGWATYITLFIIASVNWDLIIVKHNLKYPKTTQIDTTFLLELSPKTLPILLKNRNILSNSGTYHAHDNTFYQSQQQQLDMQIDAFIKTYKNRSWLAWNYADANAYQLLISTQDEK